MPPKSDFAEARSSSASPSGSRSKIDPRGTAPAGGVVASPLEIVPLRQKFGSTLTIVTPGVRPAGSDLGDQKRVMSPAEAIRAGADYLVIGRPITKASDPLAVLRSIASEIEACG